MEIKSLFGLPAHPLLVHVPVVLLPLAAVGAVLMCWPSWRARIGWITVLLAGVSLFFVQLAIGSGEQLQEDVRESSLVSTHADMADQLRPFAALFFFAVLGVMVWDWYRKRQAADAPTDEPARGSAPARGGFDRVLAALLAGTVVLAALSTIWTVRVGHSGAKATWHETQQRIDKGGGEGGGDRDEGARAH
jgi:hypothetical protein